YSEPQTQEAVNRWKEQMRDLSLWTSYKVWQVVKVALTIPVLSKSLSRDLLPLKTIMVSEDWNRVVRRLVPVSWDRGYDASQIPPAGVCSYLNKAETEITQPRV
ncbi:MAG: transposase, partial [Nitrospirae bacterium]